MIALTTPRGLPVAVPETVAEDPSPRFTAHEPDRIKAYYREHGYVVVKSVFSPEVCDTQRSLWEQEVKPFRGYIYRQATGKVEQHILNPTNLHPVHHTDDRHILQCTCLHAVLQGRLYQA